MDASSTIWNVALRTLHILNLQTPRKSGLWAVLLIWTIRISTVALLLRTFIAPLTLRIVNRHLKVGSVSFRSVRNLYLGYGSRNIKIDRISWSLSGVPLKMTIRLEGVVLCMCLNNANITKPTPARHGLFQPSTVLWPFKAVFRTLFAVAWILLDPFLRPFIRYSVVGVLRFLVSNLPKLINAVGIDVSEFTLRLTDVPGFVFRCALARTHSSLELDASKELTVSDASAVNPQSSPALSNFGSLRRRFGSAFQRSWERAFRDVRGKWSISIHVGELNAKDKASIDPVFNVSNGLFECGLRFFGHGKIEDHSVHTSASADSCRVHLDGLRRLLVALKIQRQRNKNQPTRHRSSLSIQLPSDPGDSLSPVSGSAKSPLSPLSSPLIQSIHASVMRARTKLNPPSVVRLKDIRSSSQLAWLGSMKCSISSFSASHKHEHQLPSPLTYEFTIRNFQVNFEESNPATHIVHSRGLGSYDSSPELDVGSFAARLNIKRITLQKLTEITTDSKLLFSMADIDLNGLMAQWPGRFYISPSFFRGDPNASKLHVDGVLGETNAYMDLEDLLILKTLLGTSSSRPATVRSRLLELPQVTAAVEFGSFNGLLSSRDGDAPMIIKTLSNGVFSLDSHFYGRRNMPSSPEASAEDLYTLKYSCLLRLPPAVLEQKKEILDTEPLQFISLDAIECVGSGDIWAQVMDDTRNSATVDLDSLVGDFQIREDRFAVELWRPELVEFLGRVLKLMRRPTDPRPSPASGSILDRIPTGVSVSVSVAQFSALLGSLDVTPDSSPINRGIRLNSTISFQYSSLKPQHVQRFWKLSDRAQTRHKLYLEEERVMEAMVAARASRRTEGLSAFTRLNLTYLSVQGVAGASLSIPPHGSNSRLPSSEDILNTQRLQIDVCVSGNSSHKSKKGSGDEYSVSLRLPSIRLFFAPRCVYDILIASKPIIKLKVAEGRPQRASRQQSFMLKFQMKVNTLQVQAKFHEQSLATRFDEILFAKTEPEASHFRLDCKRLVGWVPSGRLRNRWMEPATSGTWQELLFSRLITIEFSTQHGKAFIIDCDALKMRLPYGYVLADLVRDISVVVKASKHLYNTTFKGFVAEMPAPEPEGPKLVPAIRLMISSLCLEAADDPFESQLGLIWAAGSEGARSRLEREAAFIAKVAAVEAQETSAPPINQTENTYKFTGKHGISVEEAEQRLKELHAVDWILRFAKFRQQRRTEANVIRQEIYGKVDKSDTSTDPNIVHPITEDTCPPLLRLLFRGVDFSISSPSFPLDQIPNVLYEEGSGMPRDTQFSLLVPLNVKFTFSSARLTIREYPLPLVYIPSHSDTSKVAGRFQSDIIIAEEMGPKSSVEWIACQITDDCRTGSSLVVNVPKTIMPVKSYASPIIELSSDRVTRICWGISYAPATQEITRVLDSLSSSPRDTSPAIGFWDKMRLIFHWKFRASFKGGVQYQMKGSRDPMGLGTSGAGFALYWKGNTKLLIGHENEDNELIQVISDNMSVAIPQTLKSGAALDGPQFTKICAKFRSGVKFGIGCIFERTCGSECSSCQGSSFDRKCRRFDFQPHYDVVLERKISAPLVKSSLDSYNGFRSDFVHLTLSLTAGVRNFRPDAADVPSSLHLTPKIFGLFWSWFGLFDGALALPIRQGKLFPSKAVSPKFSRHLATIKYRVSVPKLFIMHAYIDDSRETWVDGVTPWIGVKGNIHDFQVDMHQRDQASILPGRLPNTRKTVRRKVFYAAEVTLQEVDLRVLLATFSEPLKQTIPVNEPTQRSSYRSRDHLEDYSIPSSWFDDDDFREIDWSPSGNPTVQLLPIAMCPRFTYFKKSFAGASEDESRTKFGYEATHRCLLGTEPLVGEIQAEIAQARLEELRMMSSSHEDQKSIYLETVSKSLGDFIEKMKLGDQEKSDVSGPSRSLNQDTTEEWAEFDHVYRIFFPRIFVTAASRDILIRYYHCSRARRGFEYHIATRAIKYILDQANTSHRSSHDWADEKTPSSGTSAAQTLRKILTGHDRKSSADEMTDAVDYSSNDPLSGWTGSVSLQKAHCCYLIRPQLVLRVEDKNKDECIITANQARLQAYAILDNSNRDDPINGKVMSRIYTSLSGLQVFAPTQKSHLGTGHVPLEVLVDGDCKSEQFDRLVPETDAVFHYDKFNRLRLRNNVTSTSVKSTSGNLVSSKILTNHLQDQTDLIRVHIPQFTVAADDRHFHTIQSIVTKLLLFSDAEHKTHLDRLETLLFSYDFGDLVAAAYLVKDVQAKLRGALEAAHLAEGCGQMNDPEVQNELLKLRAHIQILSQELGVLFEAIKLAQDKSNNQSGTQSALLLQASTSEISWRMLDEQKELIAKLVCVDTNYSWLSRQDSSTVSELGVGDLQAFDGSPLATWTEILSKHEGASHQKNNLFLTANWTVLPPVGGVRIYEVFKADLHPMRLQLDATVGVRIMEYLWPARKNRRKRPGRGDNSAPSRTASSQNVPLRTSLDSSNRPSLAPSYLRKIGTSRSFTDLRSASDELSVPIYKPPNRRRSTEFRKDGNIVPDAARRNKDSQFGKSVIGKRKGDAAEMKTRSSQKSFLLVMISSLNILLSVQKDDSFACRDARIRTRELVYRNQTWSFEELVNQFIPADMGWKGWLKMAFHQPLIPVFPVAKELISKTKWISPPPKKESRSGTIIVQPSKTNKLMIEPDSAQNSDSEDSPAKRPKGWRRTSSRHPFAALSSRNASPSASERDQFDDTPLRSNSKSRVLNLFKRGSPSSSKTTLQGSSESQVSSRLSQDSQSRSSSPKTSLATNTNLEPSNI